MRDPADIRRALAHHKRAHTPFDLAWSLAVGPVPPHSRKADSTVARFTYLAFRRAYLNLTPPGGLSRHIFEDEADAGRGLARRLVA